ncbi:PHP domain-containing protein [Exiguobacterium mexicanum]|uniref:PHP domain-containing protein n=1 Tax=Exiguobacterium mexicanum TaxID=340146 RepID=UPI00384F9928
MKVIRSELHTHTKYSHDSWLSYIAYLFMLKVRKIDVVAITDHNEIQGAIHYRDMLKKHNIKVIVGEEIFTEEGEIIGLFLTNKIPPGLSVEKTINMIKSQGGLVYIPHPYDEKRSKTVVPLKTILRFQSSIDFIEVHNGRNVKSNFSVQQQKIYELLDSDTIPVVGSDAHTWIELGRNYMVSEDFLINSPYEFKSKMRNASKYKKKCLILSHEITKVVRVVDKISKGEMNEIFRIVFKKAKQRFGRNI